MKKVLITTYCPVRKKGYDFCGYVLNRLDISNFKYTTLVYANELIKSYFRVYCQIDYLDNPKNSRWVGDKDIVIRNKEDFIYYSTYVGINNLRKFITENLY